MKKALLSAVFALLVLCFLVFTSVGACIIEIPCISQLPNFPNGCEPVSMTMALRYAGLHISDGVFIDYFLDMAPALEDGIGYSPDCYYIGNPRDSTGWGCSVEVIGRAAAKIAPRSKYTVSSCRGMSLENLCRTYIDRGIPVVIWVTVGMKNYCYPSCYATWHTPSGTEITYNRKQHCVLLVGYDDENYYVNDPLKGETVAYTKEDTETAYILLGEQSAVVYNRYENRVPAKTSLTKIRLLSFESTFDGFATAIGRG